MGWTGDIAVFSPTALYNFELSRFLEKWLRDVKAEQLPTGGIPNTVPVQGYGFPATMPEMAVDWWGDACVLVPWALYEATGSLDVLRMMYPPCRSTSRRAASGPGSASASTVTSGTRRRCCILATGSPPMCRR